MKFQVVALFFISCLTSVSYAAGGGHDDHHIPAQAIIVQFINFSVAFGLLIYLTRKAIANLFKERHAEFKNEVQKAISAKDEAERKKQEISERLKRLTSNQAADLEKAKSEAEQLRKKIITEAQVISQKLEEDAQKTAKFEFLRAIEEIRKELIQSSVSRAKEKLKETVDVTDQKRLRGEFIEKIQVVR